MCSCHSILECCVMFSRVKLSMGSFVLFSEIYVSTSVTEILLSSSFTFSRFNRYRQDKDSSTNLLLVQVLG